MSVLPRLLSLPEGLSNESQRQSVDQSFKRSSADSDGHDGQRKNTAEGTRHARMENAIILPAQKYGPPKNHENPELYTVFPYPIYGVGKPDLAMARDTYRARIHPFGKCWGQDGITPRYWA